MVPTKNDRKPKATVNISVPAKNSDSDTDSSSSEKGFDNFSVFLISLCDDVVD